MHLGALDLQAADVLAECARDGATGAPLRVIAGGKRHLVDVCALYLAGLLVDVEGDDICTVRTCPLELTETMHSFLPTASMTVKLIDYRRLFAINQEYASTHQGRSLSLRWKLENYVWRKPLLVAQSKMTWIVATAQGA